MRSGFHSRMILCQRNPFYNSIFSHRNLFMIFKQRALLRPNRLLLLSVTLSLCLSASLSPCVSFFPFEWLQIYTNEYFLLIPWKNALDSKSENRNNCINLKLLKNVHCLQYHPHPTPKKPNTPPHTRNF